MLYGVIVILISLKSSYPIMSRCKDCKEITHLDDWRDVRCDKHKKANTAIRRYKRRHIHRLKLGGLL